MQGAGLHHARLVERRSLGDLRRVDPAQRKSLVTTGRTFVAVDMLGAGVGDLVLLTQGSSARLTPETKNMPIDAVIIGIVDQVHVEQNSVYSRDK